MLVLFLQPHLPGEVFNEYGQPTIYQKSPNFDSYQNHLSNIQLVGFRVGYDVHLPVVLLPGGFLMAQLYDFAGAKMTK